MPDRPRIWIDAIGVLSWEKPRVTGIQRVEATLLSEALSGRHPDVGIAVYSRLSNEWMPLSAASVRYLKSFIDLKLTGSDDTLPDVPWRVTLAQLAHSPSSKPRYELAARIAGRSSGLVYQITKGALRTGLSIAKPLARATATFARWTGTSRCLLEGASNTVLLSYCGPISVEQSKVLARRKARLCHIFYDLIPIDYAHWYGAILEDGFEHYVRTIVAQHERIFAISEFSCDRLRDWAREQGLRSPDVVAVPLGDIMAMPDSADPQPVEMLEGKRFAVFCSTIEPRKNHLTLVRAWEKLARERGLEGLPHLVFVGHYGWLYEEAKQAIEESPAAARIHLLANLPDEQLAWAYRNAMIGLFPSVVEGWGLGVSESLVNGLPVLISDAASLNEAAQGLMPVIPACDVDGWAEEIARLLDDPDALSDLGTRVADYRPRPGNEYAGEILAGIRSLQSGPR
ncbi:glycosyltransferase family 4 protein [Tepidamorphus sp. 3E244]|uniref:glycosyltransferase family 4 protein n=1 Tax=Tepidamorphus sp. 3E244 TaxID=3385498 RepID=UPI0038FCBD02